MTEFMTQYLNEASSAFELDLMKVRAFTEAAERQYLINRNEAELKVLQECGTDDDLHYLYEAAEGSFADSLTKAIDKVISAFKEFMSKIKDKIITLVQKKESKDTVDQIEKKIKMFPLLGQKKVTIEDTDAQIKVCDQSISELNRLKAKAVAGQDVKVEEVEEVQKSFREKYGKVVGVTAAVTVTAAAAFALYKKRSSSAGSDTAETEKEGNKFLTSIREKMKDTMKDHRGEGASDPSTYKGANANSILKNIAIIGANIYEEKSRAIVRGITNLPSAIKTAFGKGVTAAALNNQLKKGAKDLQKGRTVLVNASADSEPVPVGEASQDGVTPAPEESEAAVKAAADAVAKEEGPVEDVDPLDSLDKIDPWSSVMDGLDVSVPVAGAECGPEGCDTECGGNGCNENATDSFDVLYKKIFGDAAPNPSDPAALPGGKPNNDKMIADLYKDVMAEVMVKGKNPEVKPTVPLKEGIGVESAEPVEESAFNALMKEIETLV